MKLVYKEEIELSLKAIFLLKIFYRLRDNTMYTSYDYDWMRYNGNPHFLTKEVRDTKRELWSAFMELNDTGLLYSPEVGPDCYFQYKTTKKADALLRQFKKVDTSEFDDLIPEKFLSYLK